MHARRACVAWARVRAWAPPCTPPQLPFPFHAARSASLVTSPWPPQVTGQRIDEEGELGISLLLAMSGLEVLLQARQEERGPQPDTDEEEVGATLGVAMEGLEHVRQVYHDARLAAAKAAPDLDDEDPLSLTLTKAASSGLMVLRKVGSWFGIVKDPEGHGT